MKHPTAIGVPIKALYEVGGDESNFQDSLCQLNGEGCRLHGGLLLSV
jgi:hypothetical protein